jgi:hypothetical protein
MMYTSKKLVGLIESNAHSLSHRWIDLVRNHPGTPTYRSYNEEELYKRAFRVYSQLGRWLSRDTTKSDIAEEYSALGARRKQEGFKLSEVIQALTITRRVLWFKVLQDGLLDNALDLRSALDLHNQVVHFFDRAIFFTAVGYEAGQQDSPEDLTLPLDAAL